KRINHHHCVELVASYTDPKYFGLLLSPVAEYNLRAFYNAVVDNEPNQKLLRSFFGCLAHALRYLYQSKIRHRDIKPENILIKGSTAYLADFGISLDWENLSRSTTREDFAKSWIYCAPEVAHYEERNSSADIWPLGGVFLEMLT
ncbi:kinase-like protein, partial [Mytilinidion resinicola]